ncbi:MAG TPA: hypothetical protein VMR62_28555 [Bryobacteraceae bacterium]|jgi:hypothetical protein|nr:hypothetical protein [Bryobacteraceae bacterium]
MNFADPANSTFLNYAIPIPTTNGLHAAGDLNSTYAPLFYSIASLNQWMTNNGNNYCPVEAVIVGYFPDGRYFSVTANDMHYTATQHLSDAEMDPATNTTINPFLPGSGNNWTGSQAYMVPVGFGWVPKYQGTGQSPGCGITPFEEDNLLDATQRHLSDDWNASVSGATVANGQLSQHTVDTPEHTTLSGLSSCPACGPNQAGSIVARSYLASPETCPNGNQGACNPPTDLQPFQPYLILRDTGTGCAYYSAYLTANSWNPVPNGVADQPLVYNPPNPQTAPNCATSPQSTGCAAIISTVELSKCPSTTSCGNWLDVNQKNQHINNANYTPEACYANGNPTQSSTYSSGPPNFYNRVAWTRVQQWEGSPGPDDSYIGGAIAKTTMQNMVPSQSGNQPCLNSAGQPNAGGCLIRMRFQIPQMPDTPCYPGTSCSLTGTEQMRYMSLTFWQQTATAEDLAAQPDLNYVSDPDGIVSPANGLYPIADISLADQAFCTTTPCYVTLLVNVAVPSNYIPSFLQQTSTASACNATPSINSTLCGVVQGVMPVQPPNSFNFSTSSINGYTYVDLTQFSTFSTSYPLQITIRNTLPASTFQCSGAAVPFATAEYTNADSNGGGLMGPYVPLVDYIAPGQVIQPAPTITAANLPSASSCGLLLPPNTVNTYPLTNGAGPSNALTWPIQYWPSSSTLPPYLNCGTTSNNLPTTQIDFVATQFPIPVDDSGIAGSPAGCNSAISSNNCSQIVAQSTQYSELGGGAAWTPALPITIQGQGFGTLTLGQSQQAQLPALLTSSTSPSYLTIQDCPNKGLLPCTGGWSTPAQSCQIYVSNWTDTTISLVMNLPVGALNMANDILSPLNDYTPANFDAASACPINANDNLYFTVTNPQTGGVVTSTPVTVSASGTEALN